MIYSDINNELLEITDMLSDIDQALEAQGRAIDFELRSDLDDVRRNILYWLDLHTELRVK